MKNREHLYKAKRVDNGEWVEGKSLIQGIIEGREFAQIEHTDFDNYRQYDVHPDTVCQFTGLLDKNGNKIFEGDVVEYPIVSSLKTILIQYQVVYNVDGLLKVEFENSIKRRKIN